MKKQKLFVAGLLNDNFYEAYYIIDLAQRESKEIIIDVNICWWIYFSIVYIKMC